MTGIKLSSQSAVKRRKPHLWIIQAYLAIYVHLVFWGNLSPDLSAHIKTDSHIQRLRREVARGTVSKNNCFSSCSRWSAGEVRHQGSVELQGPGLCSSAAEEMPLPRAGGVYFYLGNQAKMIATTATAPCACIILLALISRISIPLH